MRTITGLIEAVIGDENQLLNESQARLVEAERSNSIAGLTAAALALAVMLIGGTLLTRAYFRLVRSQASLQASEERFRHLVSGVKDYAIFLLDPSGRVVSWNEGAERIKGYREGEIIGSHFSRFFTPEDAASRLPERLLETAVADGRAETEGWRVRKDGSRFWANGVITAMRDAEGSLQGFAKVTRDITERRQHQIELERHRAELAQLQKMEALGQLTGGVAHDFNNLLTTILGNLELLQSRADSADPDRATRLLGAVQRAAEQGAALTQRLLAFSRRQALAPQIVDVNRLVSSMSALLHRTLGENIAIETVFAAGLWRTQVDPNQLEIAMLNLAANARDAMPGGGKLTIETGNTFLDEAYAASHTEVTPGQYVMVALSDTGEGMSEETIARAFEPFFTTKPEGRGTGLGLSQVHGFVKQSGGHVKLYSEPGQGTTIKVYLPRTLAPSVPEPSLAAPTAAASGQRRMVLLVEDNADVRRYVADALASLGYSILQASDGPAALRLLEEHREVAVLLTDVGLPGLNGRQLADEARRRDPDLKVIFITGYARNAIVHHGILDRGVDVLVKPFTVDELGWRLQRALQHEQAGERTAADNAKEGGTNDGSDFG
jgi:PAS domain S-box-containing protein